MYSDSDTSPTKIRPSGKAHHKINLAIPFQCGLTFPFNNECTSSCSQVVRKTPNTHTKLAILFDIKLPQCTRICAGNAHTIWHKHLSAHMFRQCPRFVTAYIVNAHICCRFSFRSHKIGRLLPHAMDACRFAWCAQ